MRFTTAVFCLCSLTGFSAEETIRVTSRFCGGPEEDGRTGFFFEIPISRARELPAWSPDGSAAAPLGLSAACAAAKKALQVRYSTTNEFELREIQMRPLNAFGTWYYDIECQTAKFDRRWSPCGMRAVILMDGGSVEPRVLGRDSELAEAMRQAERTSFDIEQNFARARMGDTNALAALFSFGRNVEAAKSPGFGKVLIEHLGELGDAAFARVVAVQTWEVKSAVASHLDAGVANTKVTRLQHPIAETFPLTYAALMSSGQ
jgi:hypothetical protein